MADDLEYDAPSPPAPTLSSMFIAFAKYSIDDTGSQHGTHILLSQSDKWMKQSQLFSKKLRLTDTGMAFNKFKKRTISYTSFLKYLEDLCKSKELDIENVKQQMINCGPPGSQ